MAGHKTAFLDPYKMRAAFLLLMDPEDLSCQMLVAAEVKENIWKEPAGRVTRGPAGVNHTPSLVCRDWGSLYSPELPGLGEQGLLLRAASSCGFGMLLAVCSLGGISCSGHDKQLVSASSPPLDVLPFQAPSLGLGSRWEAAECLPSPVALPRFRAIGSFQSQGKAE